MTLTNQEMRSAHFARCLDVDPDFNKKPENQRGRAYAASIGVDGSRGDRYRYATQMQRKYERGKHVLGFYVLTYSPRFKKSAAEPDLPTGTICTLAVGGEHIATPAVRRLACFRKRQTGD